MHTDVHYACKSDAQNVHIVCTYMKHEHEPGTTNSQSSPSPTTRSFSSPANLPVSPNPHHTIILTPPIPVLACFQSHYPPPPLPLLPQHPSNRLTPRTTPTAPLPLQTNLQPAPGSLMHQLLVLTNCHQLPGSAAKTSTGVARRVPTHGPAASSPPA